MYIPDEYDYDTLMEQMLNQDIIPIEEQLTIIDSLFDDTDDKIARLSELDKEIEKEIDNG